MSIRQRIASRSAFTQTNCDIKRQQKDNRGQIRLSFCFLSFPSSPCITVLHTLTIGLLFNRKFIFAVAIDTSYIRDFASFLTAIIKSSQKLHFLSQIFKKLLISFLLYDIIIKNTAFYFDFYVNYHKEMMNILSERHNHAT